MRILIPATAILCTMVFYASDAFSQAGCGVRPCVRITGLRATNNKKWMYSALTAFDTVRTTRAGEAGNQTPCVPTAKVDRRTCTTDTLLCTGTGNREMTPGTFLMGITKVTRRWCKKDSSSMQPMDCGNSTFPP